MASRGTRLSDIRENKEAISPANILPDSQNVAEEDRDHCFPFPPSPNPQTDVGRLDTMNPDKDVSVDHFDRTGCRKLSKTLTLTHDADPPSDSGQPTSLDSEPVLLPEGGQQPFDFEKTLRYYLKK